MAIVDPNRAWALFMSDPIDFILMFAVVIAAVAFFVWWFRGFIHKERMALSNDRVQKAQGEVEQISKKLTEVEGRNAELVRQIQSQAPQAVLIANATSTSTGISELRIITNALHGTLTFGGARAVDVRPPEITKPSN
jgi:hypothetical protein